MSISPPPALLERYNMPVVADLVEREQPAHLRDWFRERLIAHRLASVSFRDYRGAETEIMRARLLPVGWQARPIPLRYLFCSGRAMLRVIDTETCGLQASLKSPRSI